MLMNNLDPEVAERPEDLIVYGGTGRAARSWEAYDAIVRSLETLAMTRRCWSRRENRSDFSNARRRAARADREFKFGRALVELRRVFAVGKTRAHDVRADDRGVVDLHRQPGNCAGTFETFAAAADRHFGGSLAGKLIVTGGMGGMGGAQPLAATMNGACMLGIDVDPKRIEKRLATGYCDRMTASLDEALAWLDAARHKKDAISVGLVGNCADVLPEMVRRGVAPDILTDQTSAHDPLNGYVPNGMSLAEALALRCSDPTSTRGDRWRRWACTSRRCSR
jgi:urocanate hydratase